MLVARTCIEVTSLQGGHYLILSRINHGVTKVYGMLTLRMIMFVTVVQYLVFQICCGGAPSKTMQLIQNVN